ncbi:ABC transporter permease [Streptomyces sp. A3M-1-3]|uniref:ABC transporter permease n=1 Tax=Streptomyces sp. A3M-1-3 TaxID=2962044 RepID=UPI0020B7EF1B|nr:ABC transporter permease [Streptomyces sp. A3M-1-3]MCP3819329.1 ABC transporter permease [Streptomyces sp. A3M-1-3]
MTLHSWVAAVRIARRDAWRSKGRSSLVLAMIALPILGVSAADLTLRSAELSTEQKLERSLGAADARMSGTGMGGVPIYQDPPGLSSMPVGNFDDEPWPEGATDIRAAIPPGAKSLRDSNGTGKIRTKHGLLTTDIRELDGNDPMAKGIMVLDRGRFPKKAGEVAATTRFLESSGLHVGSKVTARGLDTEFRIVGAYELPDALGTDEINAPPGTFLSPLDKGLAADGLPDTGSSSSYLVSVGGDGFTWNMVKEANTKGVQVVSRAVSLDPPADSDVPLYQEDGWSNFEESTAAKAAALAAVGTVVGLAMLEICLLAGPAFAVGARRSRRQLGLVGANGGDRRHIRAIVLSGGLVIGVAAAVVGTVLGLLLTFALQPVLEGYMGKRFGSFDIRPLELLGIALLAVLTGVLAAIVPAITASRQTVLASLTGRRGVRRSSRVLPVIGLIAAGLGVAITLYGAVGTESVLVVAGGSALAELGVVALTPALVGLFGRTGRWLPLSPRLALRDAVRNRGRTAPAVAAVLAAVAGTVAVATYAASQDAQQRAEYRAQLPHGAVSVIVGEAGGRDVQAVRAAVQKNLSVDVRADVDRVLVGKATCSPYSTEKGCGRHEIVVPKAKQCPLWGVENVEQQFSVAERRKLAADWRCKEPTHYAEHEVVVAGPELLQALAIADPASARALKDGRAVSFDRRTVEQGKVGIRLITDQEKADRAAEEGKDAPGEIKSFAVHQAPETVLSYGVKLIVPPAAAKSAGLSTVALGAYFSTEQQPSSEQKQKLEGALDQIGTEAGLHIEEGFTSDNSIVLLALTVFAGLVTIGAAGIATGLAQTDAEPDLKTLAAVGAPPRVRRTLSGFQCGVVAAMGVVLGSAAGVLPAIGLRLTDRREQLKWHQEALDNGWGSVGPEPYVPIVVPWETLAALLIAVPVGAALLAALVTRSRTAVARRAAG